MKFQEVKKLARSMDINTHRMKKAAIVLAIQRAESNIDCYGSERVGSCQEDACLWRSDCEALSSNGSACRT